MTAGPLPQRAMAAAVSSDGSAWAATTSSISAWLGAPGAAGRSSSGEVRSQVRQLAGEAARLLPPRTRAAAAAAGAAAAR